MSFNKWCYLLIMIGGMFICGSAALASNYALLIGIGEYNGSASNLDGPPYDVAALKQVLTNTWGFQPDRIKTLVNGQASKRAILTNLTALQTKTQPGDTVFIYFSCHGTSAYAPGEGVQGINLDPFTGALVPADFKPGRTAAETKDNLIVGKRDLRPILKKLDADRQVFAVVDACYAELALRSAFKGKSSWRYLDIPWFELKGGPIKTRSASGVAEDLVGDDMIADQECRPNTDKAPKDKYPYSNLIYISASSKREPAVDINASLIKMGSRTVDGKPHGALTNALLIGLKGWADSDKDGLVTYRELHRFSRRQVLKQFRQTPQLQCDQVKGVADKPVFGVRSNSLQSLPAQPTGDLTVELSNIDDKLNHEIKQISGVRIVDQDHEIEVSQQDGRLAINLANGLPLADFGLADQAALLDRIRRQVQIKKLIALTIPQSSFNVFLEVDGRPGVLLNGDKIGFRIKTVESAYVMLVNVDVAGRVSVIYPYTTAELAQLPGGQMLDLANIGKVGPPLGTEYLKLIGFRTKPAGFDQFKGAVFNPEDKGLNELVEIINQAGSSAAQTTLTVTTAQPTDMKSLLN